ncbi:glycosyltransferase [Curtobacterium sp. 9128]|uniref:glycosyltransferase n=1 Tax=Curtobacterium sp. 9128 TaxID=1793722 RepID=UPI0011A142F1|nr:glycosyltransferase [Curtobacterium sp. 9128]
MSAVVHITDATAAGVLHVLVGYANGQVERGQQVTVLYVTRDDTPNDLSSYFDSRVCLREMHGRTRLMALWRAAKTARAAIEDDPDAVVHAHSTRAGIAVRARAMITGFSGQVVYSPHGFGFLREDLPKPVRMLLRMAERFLVRGCRRLILVSPSESRVALGLAAVEKLAVVPNSVRIKSADAARVPRDPDRPLRVVTTGRITAQKAPERFASLALSEPSRAEFVWVGDGDSAAREALQEAGVIVTGWVDGSEVIEQLAQADVFVLLSRWEGMPLALLEAQAMALPSIASDVIGNVDLIADGSNGFLVSDGAGARAALQALAASPAERLRMGQNARANASSYSPSATLRALVRAYSREENVL